MKKQLTTLVAFMMLTVSGSVFAQSAVEYMNIFTTEYRKIQQDMWDYTSSVSHGKSARKVDKRRVELIQTSNAALSKAKSAKAFAGSTMFKDSVVNYFTIVNLVLKEDYAKIVDMEAISEESYDAMEAYMTAKEKANDKLVEAAKMVDRGQRKFAEENDITLIETSDELDKKMEISGMVYDHYNEVYLIFFKSFKQEAYLMDALNRKDLSAVEQNRSALKSTAEEGLTKLDALKGYANDNSLIDVTKELLKFYVEEAEKEIPKLSDYFLKSENFTKVKTAFDQKKERDRKQEDIDAYNKAVNEMNAAVETYNKTNDLLNTLRTKHIDNWNRTAQKYTDKHVPKGK